MWVFDPFEVITYPGPGKYAKLPMPERMCHFAADG
jgi:hypothetical protein